MSFAREDVPQPISKIENASCEGSPFSFLETSVEEVERPDPGPVCGNIMWSKVKMCGIM
jgi:hypothetical protein